MAHQITQDPIGFSSLIRPIRIGKIELKNRLFISAHACGFTDVDGSPTSKLQDYVVERARGGVSLFVLGETQVNNKPSPEMQRWGIYVSNEKIIDFYKELKTAVNPYGTKLFEQISHAGGQVWPEPGARAYAPSSVAQSIAGLTPAEMSEIEIDECIEDFVVAAERAYMGGLDGVEVKCDQGKLQHQFLSKRFNYRGDKYGGILENRLRFLKRTLEQIRLRTSKDFVIGIRISGDTFPEIDEPIPDLNLEEVKEICARIYRLGYIDYVSVNGATNSHLKGYWQSHGDETIPRTNFADIAKQIRGVIKIPILVASQIISLEDAAQVIESQSADMVAMTRAHIADPDIVIKLARNARKSIRPCISCNQSCIGNTWEGREVRCIHNPAAGHEKLLSDSTIERASASKEVIVIGGGPAGLEAARVAALRGHQVTLFEKSSRLGGQLNILSRAIHRQRFNEITEYLCEQINALPNIEVKLNQELTFANLHSIDFDAIILATGSKPYLPLIPGRDHTKAISAYQVLEKSPFISGQKVIVVDEDWHLNALSIAETLARSNVHVILLTSQEFTGKGLNVVSLTSYQSRLSLLGVESLIWSEIVSIGSGGVLVRNLLTGKSKLWTAIDGVVFANNHQPENGLYRELAQAHAPILQAGDCVFPRGIQYAIFEGNRVGRMV